MTFVFSLLFAAVMAGADADAAYTQHHYKEAAALYAQIVRDQPGNALAWYRLGVSDAAIGANGEAESALNHALALGFDAMSVHYRLASVAATQSDAANAVAELRKAFQARNFDPTSLADDRAFDAVRNAPSFTSLVDEEMKSYFPCRYDSGYHALDYWKGDWNVRDTHANLVGHSHIENAADQCAIIEHWTGVYDVPGASISQYNAAAKQWFQRYVSGRGAATDYTGRVLPDGEVQFVSATGKNMRRMTFAHLPDGTVRQRFENSIDAGATWSAPNDLIYSRP